jgi:type 1 glutamine amidotransferase
MNKSLLLLLISFLALSVFAAQDKSSTLEKNGLIKVLILSGKNNHQWQKTTPVLVRILNDAKRFSVSFTDNPEKLVYTDLKKYNLIISNWNTWPDNKQRLSTQWERDFERYVNEGGGVLSLHAGASSFYDWEAYHRIGIGRWGKETHHGAATLGKVYGFDQNHPITKGMDTFFIMDEIWEKTDIYPGSKAIGSLSATDEKDSHLIDVQSVFVSQTGKGRCFFTTLGHDERALLNTGLQTLLLRAAQWCAGREVTIELPEELKKKMGQVKNQLCWNQTDTSLTLNNHKDIVWRYNYNSRLGKPYFHPMAVNHSDMTCVSPPDHPWHLGLWFSWKFINGVNYWEYLGDFKSPETGFRSEGITEIVRKKIVVNPDFSSDIRMEFNYHPINEKPVLAEERNLHISSPFPDGSYYIDEQHLFRSLSDSVVLDRTPISGEPGGQSWGGYAGLSIRFNQDYTAPQIINSTDSANCPKCPWLYMGFNSLTGEKTGMAVLRHPQFTTSSTSWYVISDPKIPFYYYSPAILFDGKIVLKIGETLRLKYRVWMLSGAVTKDKLQKKYNQYINEERQ